MQRAALWMRLLLESLFRFLNGTIKGSKCTERLAPRDLTSLEEWRAKEHIVGKPWKNGGHVLLDNRLYHTSRLMQILDAKCAKTFSIWQMPGIWAGLCPIATHCQTISDQEIPTAWRWWSCTRTCSKLPHLGNHQRIIRLYVSHQVNGGAGRIDSCGIT